MPEFKLAVGKFSVPKAVTEDPAVAVIAPVRSGNVPFTLKPAGVITNGEGEAGSSLKSPL